MSICKCVYVFLMFVHITDTAWNRAKRIMLDHEWCSYIRSDHWVYILWILLHALHANVDKSIKHVEDRLMLDFEKSGAGQSQRMRRLICRTFDVQKMNIQRGLSQLKRKIIIEALQYEAVSISAWRLHTHTHVYIYIHLHTHTHDNWH